jgi:hypothetical protein
MKRNKHAQVSFSPWPILALAGAVLFGCLPAMAQNTITPTAMTVTNSSSEAVYMNLVLGQTPCALPANCMGLGTWIQLINDPNLVFTSSVPNKTVTFTPWTPNVMDEGYYQLAAGETITYQPQTFPCAAGTCSPYFQSTIFFTPDVYNGTPNNGCGGSTVFPNATSVAETTINPALSGSAGTGCANADTADISAVNGINAFLTLNLTGASWPFSSIANGEFGTNANKSGVYGWAATGCTNDANYPNPANNCAAPNNAPQAPASGQCTTPGGTQYQPISYDGGTSYCPELSDKQTCQSQRTGGVTGGIVALTFNSFYNPSAPATKAATKKKGAAH